MNFEAFPSGAHINHIPSNPHGLRETVVGQEAFKMSDDEDGAPVVKKQRIHFGSLEAVEKERLAEDPSSGTKKKEDDQEGEENGVSSAVLAGIRAGNINISEGEQ